jgi:hypothetical protein
MISLSGQCLMFAVSEARAAADHFRAKGVKIGEIEHMPWYAVCFAEDTKGNQFIEHPRKTARALRVRVFYDAFAGNHMGVDLGELFHAFA